jgi:hypothetical protein
MRLAEKLDWKGLNGEKLELHGEEKMSETCVEIAVMITASKY